MILLNAQRSIFFLQPIDCADKFLKAELESLKILIYRLLCCVFCHAITIERGLKVVNLPPRWGWPVA